MESCYDAVEKSIRLDKFKLEEIIASLGWGNDQEFYKDKLYTLSTLRKKWSDGRTKLQHLITDYEKSLRNNKTPIHFEENDYTIPDELKRISDENLRKERMGKDENIVS